jgi:type II secretory pathway predicted ATPase ExeA
MIRKLQNRFGLTGTPFQKHVPVDELFPHPAADAALTRLKAALEGRSCAVVTGESGLGKTFLVRRLEATLPAGRYRFTYIHNATVNPRDFYRQLSMALGLEPKATPAALFRLVMGHIEEVATTQKVHPTLFLDEAHLLPIRVLEQLHILLNFQRDSQPYLSLILVGLPELRDRLARNVLASLSGRLPVRIHLKALDAQGVGDYLVHRMRVAGCAQEVFAPDAVLLIAEATGGVLRKVNTLALAALEVVANGKGSLVDASAVEEAVKQCPEALL